MSNAIRTRYEQVIACILAERKEQSMVYEVTLICPPINEVVVTSAESQRQAVLRAVYSAGQRAIKDGRVNTLTEFLRALRNSTVSVKELPPDAQTDADA